MLKKSANTTSFFWLHITVKRLAVLTAAFFVFTTTAYAQQDDAFKVKLTERAVKIINTLQLTDSNAYNNSVVILARQYYNLNQVHDVFKAAVAAIKEKKIAQEEEVKLLAEAAVIKHAELKKLHNAFLKTLAANLNEVQINKIKDGMTYNVFHITYAAYQKMILSLTDSQKLKIYDWLKEARELAMDEGSSDDKHKMFGKYKGKINNYLSAQGYNVKKEGEEWAKREEAAKKENQTKN